MGQTQARRKPKDWALTREEARAYFEEQARRLLDMDGEEFVRAWEAGEFDDNTDRRGVIELSLILPLYYESTQ